LGYLPKYIPKGSNLSKYSKDEIATIEKTLNNRFMKCLNYQTPWEVLKKYRQKKKTTGVSVV
jgi:IS30 family transposase